MRFIIEQHGVKREIVGSFQLCCSEEDAKALARQLRAVLRCKRWAYGWHDIYEPLPPGPANTPPKAWDER